MTTAPSHLDLLTIAGSVRRLSVTDDTDGLHAELARLRERFLEHVLDEEATLAQLSGPASAVARDGQERFLAMIDELLQVEGDQCNCLVRAAEVDVALGRQAKLENELISRRRRVRR